MPSDDELLTAREAAERAGVTSGTIRLWERAGRLHSIPTGDRRTGPLYSAAEWNTWSASSLPNPRTSRIARNRDPISAAV